MRRLLLVLVSTVALALAVTAVASASTLIYVKNDPQSGVPQAQLNAALPAFQLALTRDFGPIWGVDAILTTDPNAASIAAMEVDLDDIVAEPGALAYHTVTPSGKPISYIGAQQSAWVGEAWPIPFMHELFEMLADPWIDRLSQDRATGMIWSVEVCDAVESGYYAYWINGIPITDFVLPAWYDTSRAHRWFDFTHKLKRAHSVGRHGYAQWYDPELQLWHTVLG